MMKTSIVAAVAENGVIGSDGDMPWRLSTDLKRFKELTLGKPMIMGRKTFEAIGKALPGRTTIVVTRNKGWQAECAVTVQTLEGAVELAHEIARADGLTEICVVGGGQIYAQAIDASHVLHVTLVHASPKGDTVFPAIDDEKWQVESQENVPIGEKDTAATTYTVYKRRQ